MSTMTPGERGAARRARPSAVLAVALIVAGTAAGCAGSADAVSPAEGDATRAETTEQASAAVELAGATRLATRVTDSCGLAGDAATGSSVTRQYQCGVSAASFSALPADVDALTAVRAMETALAARECRSSAPVTATLSADDLAEQTRRPDGPLIEAGYLCGDQKVDLLVQRADSDTLQQRADDFSGAVGGDIVRDDPAVSILELAQDAASSPADPLPLVAVLMASITYVDVTVCEDLTPC